LKRHISISLRLTLWFSATFLLGFVLFGLIMFTQLSFSLNSGRDHTLMNRAIRAVTVLQGCPHQPFKHCANEFAELVAVNPEGHLIQVFNDAHTRVFPVKLTDGSDFPWPSWSMEEPQRYTKVWYRGGAYRALSIPVTIGADNLRILVGGQLKDNQVILDHFTRGLLWTSPIMLLLSALFGYLLSRRALDPVARLTASVRSISIGNLSRRLPALRTGDELEALAETCNDMLGRLEMAVSQINRFTADASHELRNPISYIRTVSEYALNNPGVDPESAYSFEEIVRESSEASRLLDDMLSLARADSGHAEMNFQRLDLGGIFHDAYAKAKPFANARHHEMTMEDDGGAPIWVHGDAPSLQRLLWILLDNAIKYTPDRGKIHVSLQARESEARIAVQDSGIGIAEDAQTEIFRRFYREEKARTLAEGTGLGLAIAKWTTEVHGGKLSVKSAENAGSTFLVILRLSA
jgi:signal transduction histidine kinase